MIAEPASLESCSGASLSSQMRHPCSASLRHGSRRSVQMFWTVLERREDIQPSTIDEPTAYSAYCILLSDLTVSCLTENQQIQKMHQCPSTFPWVLDHRIPFWAHCALWFQPRCNSLKSGIEGLWLIVINWFISDQTSLFFDFTKLFHISRGHLRWSTGSTSWAFFPTHFGGCMFCCWMGICRDPPGTAEGYAHFDVSRLWWFHGSHPSGSKQLHRPKMSNWFSFGMAQRGFRWI